MQRFVLLGTSVLLLLIMGTVWLGCGGGGSTSVAVNLTLAPIGISLNRGATAQITVTALNANNVAVAAPPLAFHSSNPAAITVSPAGLICAGQWDASFVNCYACSNPDVVTNQCPANGGDLLPLGTANITATALASNVTITSTTVVVTDHEPIDSVQVSMSGSSPTCAAPVTACVSQNGTAPFTLQAFSHDPQACERITGSASTPCQVPSDTVGSVNWAVSPGQVATTDAAIHTATDPVCVTASAPGQGVVAGSVGVAGSSISGSSPFLTCAVASIHVHQQNTPTPPDTETSFTAPIGGTVPLVADVFDSNNNPVTNTLALTWLTSQPALASVSQSTSQGATVQALAPGTASISAACLPPSCNVNFVPLEPVYSDNVVTANITGTIDSTVLVTTSTPPASTSSSNNIVGIDTTTTATTTFTLPENLVVNSMVITPAGDPVFLGTTCTAGTTIAADDLACSGLLKFDPTVVTVPVPTTTITGSVLTTDGNRVVVSDPTINQVFIVTAAGPSIEATPLINVSSLIAPTGATAPANTVTLTTTTPHGLSPGQSVLVAGVGVAGYNGVYTVLTTPTPTTLTYLDPNAPLNNSGGGYVTGGVSAAIAPDASKIYIVTGQGSQQDPGGTLYVYRTGLPVISQQLSGGGSGSIDPTSTQAVSFFPTSIMGYIANSGAQKDDVVALAPLSNCNEDGIVSSVGVGNSPTHIAAVPNAGLFPFGSIIPAMVDANSPNIDEIDVDASSASVCPLALTNSFTPQGFAGASGPINSFTAEQLLVTPNSQLAIILTSNEGVLVYNLGTKQTSVVTLAGSPAPQPLSGGVTPDSANLYVGATDGNVHRIDLTKTPPTDAQTIAVSLCPSVATGCNPDFVVVRPVAVVATLTSLAVTAPGNPTPNSPTLQVGGIQQFTATGAFSDGTKRDMTNFVTWISSNQVVAVIGINTAVTPPLTTPGLARALATGTTTISATSAGVTGSIGLTVQ